MLSGVQILDMIWTKTGTFQCRMRRSGPIAGYAPEFSANVVEGCFGWKIGRILTAQRKFALGIGVVHLTRQYVRPKVQFRIRERRVFQAPCMASSEEKDWKKRGLQWH